MSALTKFQPKLTPGHLRYHIDDEKNIDGYLQCDGSIVLKNTYPNLVDAIGYLIDGSQEGTLQTSGTANTINDLVYANNQYVYVGAGGVVGTSLSGTEWTSASPLSEDLNSIIYANNQFVVVGNNGLVATSPNAITWTTRTSGISKRINDIVYGDGVFVYVAEAGIIATSNDAITWTTQIPADLNASYVGGKTFSRGGSTLTTSVSLTDLTGGLSSAPAENDIVFVAVATGSTASRSQAVTGYTQVASLYADDTVDTNLFVGYRVMGATPNTSVTIPSTGSTNDAQTVAIQVWRGIDLNVFTIGAETATAIDTVLVNPPAVNPTSNSLLLIVGAGGLDIGFQIYTASYLSNFLTVGGFDSNDSTIGFGSITLTAGLYDPAAWTFSAADAITYSHAAASILITRKNIKKIKYGNSKYIYVANTGTTNSNSYVESSNNATTWENVISSTDRIEALEFLNNTFIFAGGSGIVSTSPDGITWTARTTGSSETFNAITYDDFEGLYAVIGTGTSFFTSPDAVTWTPRTKSTSTQMNAFIYDSGLFVYAGNSGVLGTSSFYTYEPLLEFKLPTSVSPDTIFNVSGFSFSFTPKAYIKYE